MQIQIIQKNINDTDYVRYLEAASAQPVDLVCFGELSTSGCLYKSRKVDSIETILKSLEKYAFGVLLGFPYQTDRGLFNTKKTAEHPCSAFRTVGTGGCNLVHHPGHYKEVYYLIRLRGAVCSNKSAVFR